MTDFIEKQITLRAPVERVWRAITDAEQFGQWFMVDLETPFRLNELTCGRIRVPGYENVRWEAKVVALEAPRLFALEWHPYAVDPEVDYSSEPPTRVEFRLEPAGEGTRLTIVESGFDALPPGRRAEALPRNTEGWTHQIRNIEAYVDR